MKDRGTSVCHAERTPGDGRLLDIRQETYFPFSALVGGDQVECLGGAISLDLERRMNLRTGLDVGNDFPLPIGPLQLLLADGQDLVADLQPTKICTGLGHDLDHDPARLNL